MKHDYNGYQITISEDTEPFNPRTEYDNVSVFALFHKNYKNESDIETSQFSSLEEIRTHIEKKLDAICLPVYLYSHSGDTISTEPFSCPWDSGQLGFAYITKANARLEYGWKKVTKRRIELLKDTIISELDIFDRFLNNDCYQYLIEKDGEQIECCCGYDEIEQCLDDAKTSIDKLSANN